MSARHNTALVQVAYLTRWYRQMGRNGRNAFWASFGGFALDAWDILLYSFVIPSLSILWSMSRGDAGIIATTALLTSAVGGWIGGVLSDRWGRVNTLKITIFWFCLFAGLSGLTNNFHELLAARALQGLGFGAEWAVGAALLGEIIPAVDRGKALGFVQSAWAVGWGAAALTYAAVYSLLPEAYAWRTVFFAGLLPSLFVLFLRKLVHGSAHAAADRNEPVWHNFTQIFARDIIVTTVFSTILSAGILGGYYGVMTWLPTYLRTARHLSVVDTSGFLAVVIVASWFGYITGAYLTDWMGRRACFALFAVCAAATTVIYTYIPLSSHAVLAIGAPLGFFASGAYSGLGAYLTELFPTHMRGSGMGFSYNSGRAIGATFPALVGFLSSHITLGHAIGLFTGVAYLLVIVAVAVLPETHTTTSDTIVAAEEIDAPDHGMQADAPAATPTITETRTLEPHL